MVRDASGMILHICIGVAVLILMFAATSDIALRMVPNWVSVAIALDGALIQILSRNLVFSLLAALIVFGVAIAGWHRNLMGGADVKLLAAVSLLVHPMAVPKLVLGIALAGGLLAVFYKIVGIMPHMPVRAQTRCLAARLVRIERYRISHGYALPYVVAITTGTFYVLAKGQAT